MQRALAGLATKLARSEAGAVAPTVALSLFGLIAAGGLAFDYARLASMDTELQNAADHAALAAASQLDGEAGACLRAAQAASTLVANETRFANDGQGIAITVANEGICDSTGKVRFWQNATKATAATSDANARFVEVEVNDRRANYALTPIVSVLSSGDMRGIAFAGLGSAVCKVPPLMMCNPNPGAPFNPDNYHGVGLKLVLGGGNSWAPGAFGYLDVGQANNGTPDQRAAMAYVNAPLSCLRSDTGEVDTGLSATVFDAVNVRFDIYQNGWAKNTCQNNTNCAPALNTTKDVVRASSGGTSCGITSNTQGWFLPSDTDQYVAQNAAGDDSVVTQMGYPMDICHYPLGGGGCSRLGNGNWRRDLYFKANHPNLSNATGSNWQSVTGLSADAGRYDMYKWEETSSNLPNVTNASTKQHGAPYCQTPGIGSGPTQPDRRTVVLAVVENCSSLTGSARSADISDLADAFLVMPAGVARTAAGIGNNELYVEIIGKTKASGNGENAQVIRRDVPYLIE